MLKVKNVTALNGVMLGFEANLWQAADPLCSNMDITWRLAKTSLATPRHPS